MTKLSALFVSVAFGLASIAAAQTSSKPDSLPLSTKSAKVLRLLDLAWKLDSDQVEQDKAIKVMKKVVKIDPHFAMGHEILSQISLDPAEQVNEQKNALAMRNYASPPEQTVIEWFQNAADHKLIPAITNMNDVLSKYPHDRWLVFLANKWLTAQTQYERAATVYENSGIPDSPGLMNNVAYTYAHMRQFDKAFALMNKYIAMMPQAANPQDSYAELLRMAGHYDQAIEHYRAALAIDPHFYYSQFGVADTYLLMGDEVRARQEYEIAFRKFPSLPELNRIEWRTRQATTYVRDGDFQAADNAFQALADDAHAKRVSHVEADIYRQMAIYQRSSDRALVLLAKAEEALRHHENASPADIQQEFAHVLRARVEVAVNTGNERTADAPLSQLAELSQSSDDKVVDSDYQGALGARLFSEHKYKEAISHLEEDTNNPCSLKRLAAAYQRTGDMNDAKHTEEILMTFNDPTLEQSLVVPPFRKCLENSSCSTGMKNASTKQ
jgi:tetratricopeptide (TPR) repeat protein